LIFQSSSKDYRYLTDNWLTHQEVGIIDLYSIRNACYLAFIVRYSGLKRDRKCLSFISWAEPSAERTDDVVLGWCVLGTPWSLVIEFASLVCILASPSETDDVLRTSFQHLERIDVLNTLFQRKRLTDTLFYKFYKIWQF